MSRIAIIGGSGFVGTRLVELLTRDGKHRLRNIDKQPSSFHPEITEIANVLDKDALVPLLKGADAVVLLAAEHRDDVSPVSLYYDVNVQGMKNVLSAMEESGVRQLVFTSSVAVYGLDKPLPDENYPPDPFNHYGKSKWQAEQVLQEWYAAHPDWNIHILRPTVIFGERNRGNVYNLLKQIKDCLTDMRFWGDDKQVVGYLPHTGKYYSDRPRWEVEIVPFNPPPLRPEGMLLSLLSVA